MEKFDVEDCNVIHLDKVHNRAGNITIIEGGKDVLFRIKRVYYVYDIPGGVDRGGHAHKNLYELIIAANGSFSVTLDDHKSKKEVKLNRPYYGLLIKPGVWRELFEFSSGAICLVITSDHFDESDYIRDYSQFEKFRAV